MVLARAARKLGHVPVASELATAKVDAGDPAQTYKHATRMLHALATDAVADGDRPNAIKAITEWVRTTKAADLDRGGSIHDHPDVQRFMARLRSVLREDHPAAWAAVLEEIDADKRRERGDE